jgi:hypothetical protein
MYFTITRKVRRISHVNAVFRHTGIEEYGGNIPQEVLYCTLPPQYALDVHHPMARRVIALTFHRHTFPRCGDRLRLADRSKPLSGSNSVLRAFFVLILRMSQFTFLTKENLCCLSEHTNSFFRFERFSTLN